MNTGIFNKVFSILDLFPIVLTEKECLSKPLMFLPHVLQYKVGNTILLSLVASRSCSMLLQGRPYEAEPRFPEPLIFAPFLLLHARHIWGRGQASLLAWRAVQLAK